MILTLPDSLPLQTLSPLINRYDYGQNRKSESDRLLNVAISRARIKFILVSNESFLSIHSKPDSSLSALLDSTKTDEKGRKKRLKLLINTINEHLNEITELSLFGKKGDRIKLTSSSKTAWEMRREFWDSNDIAELYVSSTFFKTSLVPTLIRNIGKNKEKKISIHYGKRFKINEKEKSLFSSLYPETYELPFSFAISENSFIYGSFHSTREKEKERTVPFIILKKYKSLKKLLTST